MRRLARSLFNVVFLALAIGGAVSAQTITASFSGSGSSSGGGSGFSGTGSGTLTPGGAATVTLNGVGSHNDNCASAVQITLKIVVTSGDSITLLFTGPSNSNSSSFTLTGSLSVTAGTGAYAGKGGSGTGSVSVQQSSGSGAKTFTYVFSGSFTLAGSLVPAATVNPSGMVPVYSDVPILEPGSWVSVYGTNLANSTVAWNGNFPTTLGNVTVTIDGKPAYLWFVSSGQINLQVPDDANTGCVPFVVNTPNGTVSSSVQLASVSPSLSMLDSVYAAAVILTPNGSGAYGGGTYDLDGPVGRFSYPTRPAKRGESVVLYGVGFGPTNPAVPAGQVYSGAAPTVNNVQVNLTPD